MARETELTRLAYDGQVFRIELYVDSSGNCPAENFLESLSESGQRKFMALFVRMGDHGKIWNEQKFKHLTETDQIFEFKADDGRILSFFFHGRRLILTHGFKKQGQKTPKGEITLAEKYKKEFEARVLK